MGVLYPTNSKIAVAKNTQGIKPCATDFNLLTDVTQKIIFVNVFLVETLHATSARSTIYLQGFLLLWFIYFRIILRQDVACKVSTNTFA